MTTLKNSGLSSENEMFVVGLAIFSFSSLFGKLENERNTRKVKSREKRELREKQ